MPGLKFIRILGTFMVLSVFQHRIAVALPSSPKSTEDVWMPNLRGLPLGRNGEVVAEFEVASSPIRSDADDDYEDYFQRLGPKREDDYKPCLDPDSRATLFPLNNYEWDSDGLRRPLTLRTEARRLSSGRFSTRNGSDSFNSVVIEGRCCWEAFTGQGFQGRMLRLCRGKYNANILGKLADNIKSIRPVEHFL